MNKAILYIHGKGGSYLEAEQYKKNCSGFDIIAIDYDVYLPWSVEKQIKSAYDEAKKRYEQIDIIGNSIGAYFAMSALQLCDSIRSHGRSPQRFYMRETINSYPDK